MPLSRRFYKQGGTMKLTERISWLVGTLQDRLFPSFEKCYETRLTEQEQHLVKILEILRIEKHVFKKADNQWIGRQLKEREAIARAFVAKMIYKHIHTRLLLKDLQRSPNLKRICGFSSIREIPSESTFSRAFFEFAKDGLGEKVHKVLVESHLKAELVGHISRDSTAIEGREKAAKKEKSGRPKKKRDWTARSIRALKSH